MTRRFAIHAIAVALMTCLSALLGACASKSPVDVAPEVKLDLIASQDANDRGARIDSQG